MDPTEACGLMLPRCCAHLMTRGDGPPTARTPAVTAPAGLSARAGAAEYGSAAEPFVLRLPASRAVGA
ncbi:hypothetical protein [Streptomyces sp. NPDC007984]|uniref:hypothetical protein n=1 Tax=Streptomyces sp. NPDC007984 TaxID=3364801 RepID=UPI0036EA49E3